MAGNPFANEHLGLGGMEHDCLEFLGYDDFSSEGSDMMGSELGSQGGNPFRPVEDASRPSFPDMSRDRGYQYDQSHQREYHSSRTSSSKSSKRQTSSSRQSSSGSLASAGSEASAAFVGAQHQEATSVAASSTSGSRIKRKPLKKAPDAPVRFKNPYIFFVQNRMASLKSLPISIPEKMSQVAAEWSSLSPNSRQEFERYAEADKVRYFDEMKTYSGPMHVPNKRTKKPPGAPKRAMSAFLGFSQAMRPKLRVEFPTMKNTEVSILLAQRWKEATEDEKRSFVDKEVCDRKKYHEDMTRWKAKEGEANAAAVRLARNELEAMILKPKSMSLETMDSSPMDLAKAMRERPTTMSIAAAAAAWGGGGLGGGSGQTSVATSSRSRGSSSTGRSSSPSSSDTRFNTHFTRQTTRSSSGSTEQSSFGGSSKRSRSRSNESMNCHESIPHYIDARSISGSAFAAAYAYPDGPEDFGVATATRPPMAPSQQQRQHGVSSTSGNSPVPVSWSSLPNSLWQGIGLPAELAPPLEARRMGR